MASIARNLFPKLNFLMKVNSNSQISSRVAYLNNIQRSITQSTKCFSNAPSSTPYEIVPNDSETKQISKDILNKINEQAKNKLCGRLFAVVHVAGKQFKITESDVIVIEGHWPPDVGDKIRLDKVLLVGGTDFTLIGRPLVQPGAVSVEATVIEKTLSHTKTHFKKKRRKQYKRINFYRIPQTMLRINSIKFVDEIGNPPDVRVGPTTV